MKKTEISQLTDHLGYWMRMVSNQVSHSFAQKLATQDVTVAEWVILRKMYESSGVISPSQVADATGLTRGAVSKLVTRLLDKGLVSRRDSKDDRRCQELELTRESKTLIPGLAAIADENDAGFFSVLTRADQSRLKELLEKLASAHRMSAAPID